MMYWLMVLSGWLIMVMVGREILSILKKEEGWKGWI